MEVQREILSNRIKELSPDSRESFLNFLRIIENAPGVNDISLQLAGLTDEEFSTYVSIMTESMKDGTSDTYDGLYSEDYDEQHVSIEQFISDPHYLGGSFGDGEGIYPYWKDILTEVFEDKSTIAEVALTGCLVGDTQIPLLDGTTVGIKDIVDQFSTKDFYLYTYDQRVHEYIPGKVSNVFDNGTKPVYKITLDNGKSVTATSNHKFLTRSGHWASIDNGKLVEGLSMMPFTTKTDKVVSSRGNYEVILHPKPDGTSVEEFTHRLVMRWKYLGSRYSGVVHHKDFDRYNNNPDNLLLTDWWSHRMYHAYKGGKQFDRYNELVRTEGTPEREMSLINMDKARRIRWSDQAQLDSAKSKMSDLNSSGSYTQKQVLSKRASGYYDKLSKKMSEYNSTNHPSLIRLTREEITRELSNHYNYRDASAPLGISNSGLDGQLSKYGIIPEDYTKTSPLPLPSKYWTPVVNELSRVYSISGKIDDEIYSRETKSKRRIKPSTVIRNYFDGDEEYFSEFLSDYNHKIVSIEYVGEQPTYDIEVDGTHNFAISSGIVAHNSIGTGKSTIAVVGLCYVLHKLLCLRDPAQFYGLAGKAKIALAIFNIDMSTSYGIGYSKMQSYLKNSPWFLERGTLEGRGSVGVMTQLRSGGQVPQEVLDELDYVPGKDIHILVGSKPSKFIGYDVFSAFMDEMNFYEKGNKVIASEDDLMKLEIMVVYSTIKRRIVSRFMSQGAIPGKVFLVSSKKAESSPLELYIKKQGEIQDPDRPTIKIVDEPLWVVKWSPDIYGGKFFKVLVGDQYTTTRILSDSEDVDSLINDGRKVIDVPIEHYSDFQTGPDQALTDIAGVALVSGSLFLDANELELVFDGKHSNGFTRSEVVSGLRTQDRLMDYFDVSKLPLEARTNIIYIHIDASQSIDRTGIGGVIKDLRFNTRETTDASGNKSLINSSRVDHYDVLFAVGIKAPTGDQIPFTKILDFVVDLKNLGYSLNVTMDSFQSTMLLQSFNSNGIPASVLSMDRSPQAYNSFHLIMREGRVSLVDNDILKTEFIRLERDALTGKIDHPMGGSKDISDAVVGCIENSRVSSIPAKELARSAVSLAQQVILEESLGLTTEVSYDSDVRSSSHNLFSQFDEEMQ